MAPAVAGKLVVIGSCAGTIHGLDVERGEPRWSYDTRIDGKPTQFHGEALVKEGVVFIGADGQQEAHLYALDGGSGEVLWKRTFSYGIPTRILDFDESLAFVTGEGVLVSIDPKDGSVRWQVEPEERTAGRQRISAASMGDAVAFHAPDGDFYLFDAFSGEQLLRTSIGAAPSADPVVMEDQIYIATESSLVIRIDGRTGDVVAQKQLNGQIYGSLQSGGDRLFALVDRGDEGLLLALDARLERVEWEQTAEEWSSFRPLLRDEVITVGGRNSVCSFRTTDGVTVDCVPIEGTARGIGGGENHLFVGTIGGRVVAVSPPTGRTER